MSIDLDTALTTLAAGTAAFNRDHDPAHALATLAKLLVDVKITAAQGALEWVIENYDSPAAQRMLAAATRLIVSAHFDIDKAAAAELRRDGRLQ